MIKLLCKKFFSIALVAMFIFGVLQLETDAAVENLALGKTVKAVAKSKSGENGLNSAKGAKNAVDGNIVTEFETYTSVSSGTFQVDLGSTMNISTVVLKQAKNLRYITFTIDISKDETNWETIYPETTTKSSVITCEFTVTQARFVRLNVINIKEVVSGGKTYYGFGLKEFEIYNGSPSDQTDIATNSTDTNIAQTSSDVTVNWNDTPIKEVGPYAYGMNSKLFFDPKRTSPKMLENLEFLTHNSMLRLHTKGMMYVGSWLTLEGSWDPVRAKSALANFTGKFNMMLNLPDSPAGTFSADKDFTEWSDNFAKEAADLVKVVNIDNKYGVEYWEVPNEKEKKLTAEQMGDLISKSSKAMKAVDPTIKVGGPAISWIDASYVKKVVQVCVDDIDFVSCHYYPSAGNAKQDASVLGAGKGIYDQINKLRTSIDLVSGGKYLPIFLDEYNIAWDHDDRMHTSFETVFCALAITSAITGGADGTNFWEAETEDMGLMDNDFNLYFTANLYDLLNRYFNGAIIPTTVTSASEKPVVAYATKDTNQKGEVLNSIMLINYQEGEQVINLKSSEATFSSVDKYQFDANGFTGPQEETQTSEKIVMPKHSVVILTNGAAGESKTANTLEDRTNSSLNDSVALFVNSSDAFVNNQPVKIDVNNNEVKPIVKDERTLVPVRFVSESLKFDVDWHEDTKTVTIKSDTNEISFVIGGNTYVVNGMTNVLDVPAQTINDRTMIPLRVLVESLGKKVFWDDRGLIVISQNESLDSVKDKEIIDNIIAKFNH